MVPLDVACRARPVGKRPPSGWWGAFWRRYAAEHGLPLAEAYEQWFRQQPYPDEPEALQRSIDAMSPRRRPSL